MPNLLAGPLILLIIFFVLVRTALVVVTVESTSMYPTLNDGDRVLALRYWPARWLRKGQIVLVWPWLSPLVNSRTLGRPDFAPFIKRIVALPGETIVTSITDLDERHHPHVQSMHDGEGNRTWHIPPGHLFVRGDYVPGGVDSLTWGPIPFKSVIGLVVMRLPGKPL
jgi:signal peptidase I